MNAAARKSTDRESRLALTPTLSQGRGGRRARRSRSGFGSCRSERSEGLLPRVERSETRGERCPAPFFLFFPFHCRPGSPATAIRTRARPAGRGEKKKWETRGLRIP